MEKLEESVTEEPKVDSRNTICPVCTEPINGRTYLIGKYGMRIHQNNYCDKVCNED